MKFSLASLLILSVSAVAFAKRPISPRSFTDFKCHSLTQLDKCSTALGQVAYKADYNIIVSTEFAPITGQIIDLDNVCGRINVKKVKECNKCQFKKCYTMPVTTTTVATSTAAATPSAI